MINEKHVTSHNHFSHACIDRVGYVTVLEKTKYSTVARRMLLLATATDIKKTKRGFILVNQSFGLNPNGYILAATLLFIMKHKRGESGKNYGRVVRRHHSAPVVVDVRRWLDESWN